MGFEFQILDGLQTIHTPMLDTFMTSVTKLGDAGIAWIILTIILLLIPKTRKAGEGNLLTRLSREQFTKDKKRTFMVLLSLAASLSVYLCVVTMLDSQAARTIVSNFMDSDLTGWNGSIVERIKGVE